MKNIEIQTLIFLPFTFSSMKFLIDWPMLNPWKDSSRRVKKSTFHNRSFKHSLWFQFDLSEGLSVFKEGRKVDIWLPTVGGLTVVTLKNRIK